MEQTNRLGIDFGTTYCCMGVWKDGGIEIIPNGIGERTTPSVVIFDSPNEVYVGEETLYHISKKDTVKIYEIKRIIGKRYDEIEDLLNYFPFRVEEDNNGYPVIKITFDNNETKTYSPIEIAHLIFKKLIANAEIYLNQKISEIVITVPADFSDNQRNAIKVAAELNQGIQVKQIINEPCAAVLSYGFPRNLIKNLFFPINNNYTMINTAKILHPMEDNNFGDENDVFPRISLRTSVNNNKEKQVLVFDLGGGTYDVSLIEINDFIFVTKASSGDQHLGGGDFDNVLMEYSLEQFCNTTKQSINEIKSKYKCMQRLKIACEQTKKILSIKESDTIYIEDFYDENTLNCQITRAKFISLCKEYFDKLIPPIDKVLSDAKKKETDINEIILVGGSSKIPYVKAILSEKFKDVHINDNINPDEAVAYGATLFFESLYRNNGEFWEDFNFLDSTQHSYGVEVEDGSMEIILPRGSKYPTSVTKFFSNAYDDQYTFNIKVYQGENKMAYENEFLAEFTLQDVPKKPKGELIMTVMFSIDENQILNVSAYVAEGNKKNSIQIRRDNQNSTLVLGNISILGNGLNKEEKQLKAALFNYSKKFRETNNEKDKLDLIKNYNRTVNDYLAFLENRYSDTDSEKYLYLVEKLFKSYSYYFKTKLVAMIDLNEKIIVQNNIEKYLKKISENNPFRLKQLLMIFYDIKKEKSTIFYTSTIYAMDLLLSKGNSYFEKKDRNSLYIAKNLYEECLLLSTTEVKENVYLLDIEIYRNHIRICEDCENKIKLISLDSHPEIEKTKRTGDLFNNENNLDYDNLSLLSDNLKQSLKKINTIDDLQNNKEALEAKSICLANIVKIEYLIKKNGVNPQNLLQLADESICIADKLGLVCTSKNWYHEIMELRDNMKNYVPAPSIEEDIEKIKQELEEHFNYGVDEFIQYLLKNHPYDNSLSYNELLNEYQKDRKVFIMKLIKKYKNFFGNNNNMTQKKAEINKYLNNCLNKLEIDQRF
jgi:L1 cell adhesion molecule like protein